MTFMKENWKYKNFEDCLENVKYTNKIQTSDYLNNGSFPIISQEDVLISGYWNNSDDVFKIKRPIVIFGDHTRVLKYVDFDFVLGADGVKVLQPVNELSAKFLFYFLIWQKIPSLGYSRHYKLLKELSIPVPPLPLQQQIVAELDLLSGIIEKQKRQLTELDKLAQATFYDMFGDPNTNYKKWNTLKFKDAFKLKSGDGLVAKDFIDGEYPVYGGNGICGYHNEYNKNTKTIIIGRVGVYCGNARLVKDKFWLTDNAFETSFNDDLFVYEWLPYLLNIINLHQYANHAAQPVISNVGLKDINIILPPLPLQQSFASKIEVIERQKELINNSIKESQRLFDSRMEYWFG